MRFALVDQAKKDFPVHRLCQVLGVSQSGYFAWKDRPASRRQRDDMVMLAHVRSAFALSNGTYGSPRMTRELQDDGFAIGRRRTARLMRENGLRGRQKRRFKRTTDSEHAWPIAPNIIDQDFAATAPNQKWGVDISYVWTREGWLYLAVVIDLFSRRVVGWAVGDRRHCQDFRVWAGIMGKKEIPYVTTQRACDTERASRSASRGRRCERRI